MTETKEQDRYFEEQHYKIGDIVELRKPKGILGVIKYIGAKKNSNGELISNETHYVIQLEEYVGNGNGSWNGYKYIDTLRPDKTMELCKYNNIRCKRCSDDVLKALYNILRAHNKLQKQIKRQQSYINDLEDINYKFEQRLESQTYFFMESNKGRSKHTENTMEFIPKLPNSPPKQAATQSMISSLTIVPTIPQSTSNVNLNESTPHQTEFGGSTEHIMHRMDRIESDNTLNTESVNGNFSRSEKWVTLSTNNINMITPPPNTIHLVANNSMDILQKTRRSHRRNESQDYDQQKMNGVNNRGYHHRNHQSATFAVDRAMNMSQITELTRNDSDLTKNNMNDDQREITPAPERTQIGENQQQNSDSVHFESVNVKQKKKDICDGGNIDTVGKKQLMNRELQRQKSMEKIKNANIVNNKVDVFERMIIDNKQIDDRADQYIGDYDDRAMLIHRQQIEAIE